MRSLLSFLFGTSSSLLKEEDPMKKYLIAGLGNIGPDYVNTRHNIGFQVLDALAEKKEIPFAPNRLGETATYKIKGRSVLLLKPSTFMNRSGKAVHYWLEKEKIPREHLLIITDDINLPFGTLRLKTKGSDGGHNGLADVQQTLQTANYNRLRFGLGSDFPKGRQVEYVLGSWNEEEIKAMPERLNRCVDLVESFVLQGVNITMNTFNNT
ncbi:aminoacyl-tRNA hydrolase [Muriicola marianensis]|uniref:Peptidyl-tRNA hydrolase n=1 Tax=Muriicola marianensis TaxID=1324801 RepID=A0ABQ1QWN6_9FLAO|nr:aminoacyl-tRNA hydrolase [Muriicola marianensis]GGD47654.1 peptidyl-tRNA hydrolase [Muriicola marianensis]